MVGLTDAEVIQRISREEWRLHCRRRTRGAEESTLLIQDLLDTFCGPAGHDSLGIPLLDAFRIQDPPGVQLYTQTGRLTKGLHIFGVLPPLPQPVHPRYLNVCRALAPQQAAGAYRAKKPEEVDAEAWAHVASEGGDTSNAALVLSRWKIQFGKYQGKIFHWLNLQDAFVRYSSAYPDFVEAVRFVNYLRRKAPAPGTQMENAVRYIRRRNRQRAAAAGSSSTSSRSTASVLAAKSASTPALPPTSPEEPSDEELVKVVVDIEEFVASEGGDTSNAALFLSRWKIQFGKYQGKIFHWLLENDVGYTVNLVASHQKERERTGSQSPLMANKDAFVRYSSAYPDFVEAVRFHRAFEEAGGKTVEEWKDKEEGK
ncbi:uncharacterized protein LOC115796701 [Scomber scombrus]|uniref:Uncharacterized protein LOC115796701 n=1 Tax=Scomber scombrus TaxID=13677 RepID=A0AAV1QIC6_SCOSC